MHAFIYGAIIAFVAMLFWRLVLWLKELCIARLAVYEVIVFGETTHVLDRDGIVRVRQLRGRSYLVVQAPDDTFIAPCSDKDLKYIQKCLRQRPWSAEDLAYFKLVWFHLDEAGNRHTVTSARVFEELPGDLTIFEESFKTAAKYYLGDDLLTLQAICLVEHVPLLVADLLVDKLGFDRAIAFLSGARPMSDEVAELLKDFSGISAKYWQNMDHLFESSLRWKADDGDKYAQQLLRLRDRSRYEQEEGA